MSELITRRTFLKAAGTAMAAAAAGGMLAGCGDGAYASTPENLVAPSIDNTDTRHNYFYTGFKLDNSSGNSSVTVNTSNFAFRHTDGGTGKVCGL